MVVSGAGADISKLMAKDFATTKSSAYRKNGELSSPLESRKAFDGMMTDKLKSDEKPIQSNQKPMSEKASPVKSEPKAVQSKSAPAEKSEPNKQTTTVEKYDEIESTQPKISAEETAMLKFLQAMKDELGVEPEEMIAAMLSLDAEAMRKPPEETMNIVLDSLNLDSKSIPRAEELYQIMLKDTASASMGKMLHENQQTVDLSVVGPEQVRLQKLMSSLDQLSQSFFEDTKPAPALGAKLGAEGLEAATPEAISASDQPMTVDDLLAHLNAEGFEISSGTDGSASGDLGSEGEMAQPEGEEFSQNLVNGQLANKGEILNTANNSRPGAPIVTTADEAANARQVVETAQLLAQKGGGTMKIQLKPEGMGFVELKVGVNAGKVDIQMITENNEVKRLLESGLSELKTGLLQHKLSLENVQVDTGNRTQPNFDNMMGQDRETAREFLEQFRQFNQNRREAGFDFANVAGYGGRNKRMTPQDVRPTDAKAKASSRKLDLVA